MNSVRRDGRLQAVFDENQIKGPSCKFQAPALDDLRSWGNRVELRMRRPTWPGKNGRASGLRIQHEKLWIFDEEMMLITSMNATSNSADNCEEAGSFLRDRTSVARALEHFEMQWRTSSPLEEEHFQQRGKWAPKETEETGRAGSRESTESKRTASKSSTKSAGTFHSAGTHTTG